jgi:putative hemolysin
MKKINIEKIISDKNPKLRKWTPKWLINWLKKILHENEINKGLENAGNKKDVEFAEYTVKDFLGAKVESYGLDNIPKEEGMVLFSNHPLGGMDGMALLIEVGKVRKDIQFLVNDLLLQLGRFDGVFVPINKHGINAKSQLERIDSIYASNCATLVFPAGLCSRLQSGEIKDLTWTKSFVSKSIKYNKLMVPCYIEARNSNWFYKLALWRKRLGIKANIEMLYLVDEMFKQKGKTIKIYFGKPFSSSLIKASNHQDSAEKLKELVYKFKTSITEIDFTKHL